MLGLRLLLSLRELGLPALPGETRQPLRFAFLEDLPDQPPVMTGHTQGLITVNIKDSSTDASVKKGEVTTVTVMDVRDGGLEVQAGEDGPIGFIRRSDLGRDRDEQRPDRFQVGQKVDAMITGFDRSKKPNFSIKARQIAEEKEAVQQFGSSDSGASLGDILGEALKGKDD